MTTLYRNFGFLLKDTGRLYTKRFEERARAFGLTLMQTKALVHLARNEGVSQKRLCELADIEPMAMVRIIDRMASDGWIVREADPLDRRAHSLRTTEKSKPVQDRIWEIADQTRNEFIQDLSATERRAFVGMLERIHKTALALEPAGEEPPLEEPVAATATRLPPSKRKTPVRRVGDTQS